MNKINNFLLLFQHKVAIINFEPIIILGNQKSGTTVIANLIALATNQKMSYDILYRAHLSDLQYLIYRASKKIGFSTNSEYSNYLDLIFNGDISLKNFIQRKKFFFSSKIIKEPDFTFFYNELLATFPNARFVFVARNPYDNIRSILNRLNLPGNLDQEDREYQKKIAIVKQKLPLWGKILEGRNPDVFGENYITNLALRWNLAVDTYLHNADNIVLIRYEDFVQDKVKSIEYLCEKLLFEIVTDISNHIDKQYQPKGKSNINPHDFFGDINYKIIYDLCKERMAQFDYS